MGEPVMLKEEDVVRIGDYVKPWLREVVNHVVPRAEKVDLPAALLERMVRVEEELKALRVLMDERFGFMERRFEAVDKRFEAVDKRFEAVDKRFEDMNKRFADLIGYLDKRFEAVDKRFEAVDKRFEDMNHRFGDLIGHLDKRFEAVDKRFADLIGGTNKRFNTLTWMIGVGFVVVTSLTTVFALLA